MNTTRGIFSRKSDEWSTPSKFFTELNNLYDFNLDAASTDENALCKEHFTKETDGLKQNWVGKRVWCNPPYSDVRAWVDKALSTLKFYNSGFVVMLLPARTDTEWFHKLLQECEDDVFIKFIRGRLRFNESKQNAPFPSILVFFNYFRAWEYARNKMKRKENDVT